MIVQSANKKLEYFQLGLGILLLLIFIVYSCQEAFKISPTIIWSTIVLLTGGIVYLMRTLIKYRTFVKPFGAWSAKKINSLKPDLSIKLLSSIIFILLGALHFYIVDYSNKDITPLIYDYSIGLIGAMIFQLLISRNWHIGLSNQGIIFGSKLDSKIIFWQYIDRVEQQNNKLIIHCNRQSMIKKIILEPGSQIQQIKLLIEQSIK